MNWLKKIFSSDSPNRIHYYRPTRVRLTSLHRVHFRQVVDGKPGERLDVGNISTGGVLILFDPRSKSPKSANTWKIGSTLEGCLSIDQKEFSVQLQVRHSNEEQAGLEFASDSVDLKLAIESYLRVEILGLNLLRVSEKYLRPESNGKPVWLTDGRENEIYIVTQDAKVVSFQMSFLGNYVEGGTDKPTRAGIIDDIDDKDEPRHKPSSLSGPNLKTEAEILKYSLTFLSNAERLPSELRTQIESFIGSR